MTTRNLKLEFANEEQARAFDMAAESSVRRYDVLLAIEEAIATIVPRLQVDYGYAECPIGVAGIQVFTDND